MNKFEVGQFVRNKNTGAIYLLLEGKSNNPECGEFDFTTIEKGTTTFSKPLGIIQKGCFYSTSYEVVELSVKDGFKPVEKFYKVGDKFKYKIGNDNVHIIATINMNNTINLIDTETGLRWYTNGLEVNDWDKISEKEIKDILNLFDKVN